MPSWYHQGGRSTDGTAEAMRLVPLRKGEDGIVPSHLLGLSRCLRALGRPHNCARVEPLPGSACVLTAAGVSPAASVQAATWEAPACLGM